MTIFSAIICIEKWKWKKIWLGCTCVSWVVGFSEQISKCLMSNMAWGCDDYFLLLLGKWTLWFTLSAHCSFSSNSFHGQITQKAVHQLSDPEKKFSALIEWM